MKPSPARFHIVDRIHQANELIREDIEKRGQGYFINVFDAMLDADRKPQPKFFEEDGLHMNRAGYALWTQLLEAYRQRIFAPNCPAASS